MSLKKRYLRRRVVYVEMDIHNRVILTTSDGIFGHTNTVILELEVFRAFADYVGGLLDYLKKSSEREAEPGVSFYPWADTPAPVVGPQQIVDAGLNAFALQLFAESVAGKEDAKTFDRFAFIFRNIKVTLGANRGCRYEASLCRDAYPVAGALYCDRARHHSEKAQARSASARSVTPQTAAV